MYLFVVLPSQSSFDIVGKKLSFSRQAMFILIQGRPFLVRVLLAGAARRPLM